VTLKLREYQIRAFASALVERGVDPASLKTLADLVRPATMQLGLEFHLKRHEGRVNPALPGLVAVLQSIARDWVSAGPDDLARIQNCLADIRAELPRRGMTQKNVNRLRPFDSRDNAMALLRLPSRLFELAGQRQHPRQAALMVQDALAIEILLMALLRIGNLTALDTVRHLIPVDRGRGAIHLIIPGNEVKTGHDLEYPLPGPVAALLRRYQAEFRPVLAEHGSTALFPGLLGRPRNPEAFGRRISAVVFEHTQLRMNPHLFRHTMAKLYLKLFPKDRETMRIALGHSTLATTDYYIELNNAAALRHFNQTILDQRGGVSW
jgi:integrase